MQFFDAPFRVEESPDAASAIRELRDLSFFAKRVPQPYLQEGLEHDGPDLLEVLREDISSPSAPCIRFILGNAGAGKSVLFKSLFAILYRDFIDNKNKRRVSLRADRSRSFRNIFGLRTRYERLRL